ncbi:MAG: CRISPR system precrRNA processing endoribonuclease RAMP protein Cas6 [Ignavibacteriaceae bacterium]|nr:CRISPR system precrRNA processing endoribonuclease RAMP protein Cas6 [Ignavibacteriaceae bacterium]
MPEYKGSMFRGAFGWAFRGAVCLTKQPVCDNCMLKSNCSYFTVFETEAPNNDIPYLRGVKKVPHPFIMQPPLSQDRHFNSGDTLEVTLSIFGKYSSMLPFFIYSYIKMGEDGLTSRRIKFSLESIDSLDESKNRTRIYDRNSNVILENGEQIDIHKVALGYPSGVKRAVLDFVSPLRMIEKNITLRNPGQLTKDVLLSSILRRYKTLNHFFNHGQPDAFPERLSWDNLTISENTVKFYDWERYSSRQKTSMQMGGYLGKLVLEGEIDNIVPLLKIGEYINAGKNSVFGLGKYNLFLD